jgi:hypothetical protein
MRERVDDELARAQHEGPPLVGWQIHPLDVGRDEDPAAAEQPAKVERDRSEQRGAWHEALLRCGPQGPVRRSEMPGERVVETGRQAVPRTVLLARGPAAEEHQHGMRAVHRFLGPDRCETGGGAVGGHRLG